MNYPTFVERPKWQHTIMAVVMFVRMMRHPDNWAWGKTKATWSTAWRFRGVRLTWKQ